MKYIFQANLIIIVVAVAMAVLLLADSDFFILILILQFFTGIFQYITSLVMFLKSSSPQEHVERHFFISTIYLLVFAGSIYFQPFANINAVVMVVYVIVIPWLLAIYFTYITYLKAHLSGHES